MRDRVGEGEGDLYAEDAFKIKVTTIHVESESSKFSTNLIRSESFQSLFYAFYSFPD